MNEKKEKRKDLFVDLCIIIFFEILKLFRFVHIPVLKNIGEFLFEYFNSGAYLIVVLIELYRFRERKDNGKLDALWMLILLAMVLIIFCIIT